MRLIFRNCITIVFLNPTSLLHSIMTTKVSRGDAMLAKRRALADLRGSLSELLPTIDLSNTPQILIDAKISSLGKT